MNSAPWERRSSRRYPLELNLICGRLKGGRVQRAKTGKTRNLSRDGVLFACDESYDAGTMLWLSIDWPASREGSGLELSVFGRVLRSDANGTALGIKRYEFHSWGTDASGAFSRQRPSKGHRRSHESANSTFATPPQPEPPAAAT